MRPILRKTVLMVGVLALFFGLVWVLQGNNLLPEGYFSNDPRRVTRGIMLFIAGAVAIFAARKI